MRNALGASRGRIVAQLFAEALVLGGVAAAVGLGVADLGVRLLVRAFEANYGAAAPVLVPRRPVAVDGALRRGAHGARRGDRRRAAGAQGHAGAAGAAPPGGRGRRGADVRRDLDGGDRRADRGHPRLPGGRLRRLRRRAGSPLDGGRLPGGGVPLGAHRARPGAPAGRGTRRSPRSSRAGRRPRASWSGGSHAEPGVVGVTFAERLPRMDHLPHWIEVDSGGAAPRTRDSRAATERAPRPSTRTTSTCWARRCAPAARSTPATSRPTRASSS